MKWKKMTLLPKRAGGLDSLKHPRRSTLLSIFGMIQVVLQGKFSALLFVYQLNWCEDACPIELIKTRSKKDQITRFWIHQEIGGYIEKLEIPRWETILISQKFKNSKENPKFQMRKSVAISQNRPIHVNRTSNNKIENIISTNPWRKHIMSKLKT